MALNEQDNNAIAKVTVGGQLAGTAFLVTPQYAVTALHVVAGKAPIELTFRGHAPVQVRQIPSKDQRDWTLLAGAMPPGIAPLRLSYFDRWHDREWGSRGWGGLYKDLGGPIQGTFYSASPLELHCPLFKTAADALGFSGCPIVTSSGVVGVMSFTRKNQDGTVRAGFAAAVTTREIIAGWPDEAGPAPIGTLAPYVRALQVCLADVLENDGLRDVICEALGMPCPERAIAARRIAERLVEEPWPTLRKLIADLDRRAPSELRDLVSSMWVPRDAARKLADLLARRREIPAIRTREYFSVRHHVMRAQGEQDRTGLITWGNEEQHLVRANADSGEALEVVVEKALMSGFGIEAEEITDYVGEYTPVYVAVNALPATADVDAVQKKFGVQLIVHSALAAADTFKERALAAELVEPVPDLDHEKKAKLMIAKPTPRSTR